MHKIVVDRIHKLVELRVIGPATVEDIMSAGAETRQAIHALGLGRGAHLSLCDLSELGTIPEAAIDEAFQEWADPRYTCVQARKVAIVAPTRMTQLRLAKLAKSRPGLSIFGDRREAMRWLLA